jgi:FixJ family two-component response regulator
METIPESQDRSIRVLLISTDGSFVQTAKTHLGLFQGREFVLSVSPSFDEALSVLAQHPQPRIVLIDLSLGQSAGLEFTLQLHERKIEIPVIFLASTRDYRLAVDAMKLGGEDFLLKDDLSESLLPRTLATACDRALRRRQKVMIDKRVLIAQKRAEAIRELVVTVCHEFNNPLAAIKISYDLLSRMSLTPASREQLRSLEERFREIEAEVRRLRNVNFEQVDAEVSTEGGATGET